MFIGVDHGTQAVRFATLDDRKFELPRKYIAESTVIRDIEKGLNLNFERVKLIGLSYSMGDGISKIMRLRKVVNRGLREEGGAGTYVGGGTAVYDAIYNSELPAVLLPGLHDKSDVDFRMRFFSHGASPEKVGVAYHVIKKYGQENFIICDVSSNTVTLGIAKKKIIGAIDAAIFAPGIAQGPLDLQAIRDVDAGLKTANEAFSTGGILKRNMGEEKMIDTLALYVAMEINALDILLKDYDVSASVFLAGASALRVKQLVDGLLHSESTLLEPWSAALGCAEIAKDVYEGADNIMGITVDF